MPELDATIVLLSIASGLAIGFFIGMSGIGGGVLNQPALRFVIGVNQATAVGTALLYSVLSVSAAIRAHWKAKNVQRNVAAWCIAGAVPAAVAASLLVNALKNRFGAPFDAALQRVVGLLMVSSILLMLWAIFKRKRPQAPEMDDGECPLPPAAVRRRGVGLGALLGALVGGTSVGGGVIMLPLLLKCFHLPARRAVGTSLAITLSCTLVSAPVYLLSGNLAWPISLMMFAGALLGVRMGVWASVRIPDLALRAIMLTIMFAAAGFMLFGRTAR